MKWREDHRRTQLTSYAALLCAAFVALLATVPAAPSASGRPPFVEWGRLRNPVLEYPEWSVKDATVIHRDGVFYLFFSAFYEDRGRVRCHVAEVSTRDFKTYSAPLLNFAGVEEGFVGMCSPDVTGAGGEYVMTFNSWGDKPGAPNQLFYRTSHDLVRWSPRRPLAANLTAGKRAIDAALAFTGDRYYLLWKEVQQTRLSVRRKLDGEFTPAGSGAPTFVKADGADASWHENYQFIKLDGRWRVLATGSRHEPFLYRMKGRGAADGDWLEWVDGYRLNVAAEGFNTDNRANAAALQDWRRHDGHFYLLYAGRTDNKSYAGRGWNRLGLSRSKDLVNWVPAGNTATTPP
jgi:hypothetical protein